MSERDAERGLLQAVLQLVVARPVAVSMLVIVGAWVAARPLVLAPIAKLFGSVSSR